MNELIRLITAWPVVSVLIVLVVMILLLWIIVKAAGEGREVTFWPPRIGPRPPNADPASHSSTAPSSQSYPDPDDSRVVTERLLPVSLPESLRILRSQETARDDDDTASKRSSVKCASVDLVAVPIAGLYIETGTSNGKWFVITNMSWRLTVGRSEECEISLPGDRHLSRSHFRIEVDRALGAEGQTYRFAAVDAASQNGISVDDQEVQRADLTHRSVIEAGNVRMRFYIL